MATMTKQPPRPAAPATKPAGPELPPIEEVPEYAAAEAKRRELVAEKERLWKDMPALKAKAASAPDPLTVKAARLRGEDVPDVRAELAAAQERFMLLNEPGDGAIVQQERAVQAVRERLSGPACRRLDDEFAARTRAFDEATDRQAEAYRHREALREQVLAAGYEDRLPTDDVGPALRKIEVVRANWPAEYRRQP